MNGSEQESSALCTSVICRIARIARLNDQLRMHQTGGRILFTRGVGFLAVGTSHELLKVIAAFDTFDEENDPHGERDFGMVTYLDQEIFWKIDYFAERLEFGSEDPADPEKTTRVMTIMLASEY